MTQLSAPRQTAVLMLLVLSWCLLLSASLGLSLHQTQLKNTQLAQALSDQLINQLTLPLLAGDVMTTSSITSQVVALPGIKAIEVRSIQGKMIAQSGVALGALSPIRSVVSSSSQPVALLSVYPERLALGPAIKDQLVWLSLLTLWHLLIFFAYRSLARQTLKTQSLELAEQAPHVQQPETTQAQPTYSGTHDNMGFDLDALASKNTHEAHYDPLATDLIGEDENSNQGFVSGSDDPEISVLDLSSTQNPVIDQTPSQLSELWQPAYRVDLTAHDAHLMNNLTPALRQRFLDQMSALIAHCVGELETSRLIDPSVVIDVHNFTFDGARVVFELASRTEPKTDHLKIASAATLFALLIHTVISRFYEEQRSKRLFALPVVVAAIPNHDDAQHIPQDPNPSDPVTLIALSNLPVSQLLIVTEPLTRLDFNPLVGLRVTKATDTVALDLLRIKNNVLNRNQIL